MKCFVFAFLIGMCGLWIWPVIPPVSTIIAIIGGVLLCALFFKNRISFLLLGLICGFGWGMLAAHWQQIRQLPSYSAEQTAQVTGWVVNFPKTDTMHASFLFRTTRRGQHSWHRLLKLGWYHVGHVPQYGQKWRLLVRLKAPRGFANPGGFDEERWLFVHHVDAVGYVVQDVQNHLITQAGWRHPIMMIRSVLLQQIIHLTHGMPLAEFLPAIILCNRQGITAQEWQVLEQTGTGHLISIAGLHIGLVALFAFFFCLCLWRRIPYLARRLSAQQAATVVGWIFAFCYALLAGFNLPTQRAFIMLSVAALALLMKREIRPWRVYCLALWLVLLWDSLSILSVSFWMSFSVVAGLVYVMTQSTARNGMFRRLITMQMVIMLSLLPCSLYFFSQGSWVSVVANVIAVPWFAVMILPAVFMAVLFLGINQSVSHVGFWWVLKNFQALWWVLQKLSHAPWSAWHHTVNQPWVLGSVTVGVVCLLSYRKRWLQGAGVLCFLPLLMVHTARPQAGTAWLTVLDVGQGLSSVIKTQHHLLIYDAGPTFGQNFDAGQAVIVPYLHNQNIQRIDTLMVSHGDQDHIGGAHSVLQALPVQNILTSVPGRFPHYFAHYCHQGQHWQWDGVNFSVLWPPVGDYDADNNSSCVLRVSTVTQTVLLTGDIESPVETQLVHQFGSELSATVLVAPHHGSRTSSNQHFVQTVHPAEVLYPIGYHNRFHFPSKVVVQRYRAIGAAAYDTATDGAIQLSLGAKHTTVLDLYRVDHRHIWRA